MSWRFLCSILLLPVALWAQEPGGAGESGPELGVDRTDLLGAPAGAPLSGEELERRTQALGKLMRCPVCQGLSIADSPSEVARNMLGQVRDLLAAGYSEQQIQDYFERAYGEFVHLEPKATPFNMIVWLAPPLALLVGAWLVWMRLRSQRVPDQVDEDLAPYLERVRREVGRA